MIILVLMIIVVIRAISAACKHFDLDESDQPIVSVGGSRVECGYPCLQGGAINEISMRSFSILGLLSSGHVNDLRSIRAIFHLSVFCH